MRYLAVFLIMSLGGFSHGAAAQQAMVNDLAEMARFSDHPLTPAQRAEFEWFSSGALYFAAFYVTPQSGGFAWYEEAGSLRAARAGAEFACRAIRTAGEGECILYAVIRPRRGPASDVGDIPQGLAWQLVDEAVEILPGVYYSVAISEAGSWGISGPQPDAQTAERVAMAFCEEGHDPRVPDSLASGLKADMLAEMRRRGFLRCRVIDTVFAE